MNREAELLKLAKTTRTFKIPGGIRREFLLDEAELNSLIDRLVIEGQNSKLDEAVDMARRADDFVGDVKVVRVTHLLSLKALLSQSSQPLSADSSEAGDAK